MTVYFDHQDWRSFIIWPSILITKIGRNAGLLLKWFGGDLWPDCNVVNLLP